MIREVTTVPKDECPLNVLAKMGNQTASAWIFLHKNAVEKLRKTADFVGGFSSIIELKWNETPKYPSTLVWITNSSEEWIKVFRIEATDIAFEYAAIDPENIFFLKMEE